MKIKMPNLSLVLLIGPSGCGKSTFAQKHFLPSETISSDNCRALVADDENDQAATPDAFALLHYIAEKRLAKARLTVIDATNVQRDSRKTLLALAKKYHTFAVAVVFDLPQKLCEERNAARTNRNFGSHVIRQQTSQMRRSIRHLKREGFRFIYVLKSEEEVDSVEIQRDPLWNDRRDETGPFDIIGDIHGCYDELLQLLEGLGYRPAQIAGPDPIWGNDTYEHPEGRKAVFLGDLVDRGPKVLETVRLVRNMVTQNAALCVPGNHDLKLVKWLNGKNVKIQHGLERTIEGIESIPEESRDEFKNALALYLDSLVSHYVLDGGNLVVAHAGMPEEMQGRGSGAVRSFALFGETTGEIDEFGLPVRYNWSENYRGRAWVIYGHTPVPEPLFLNRTVDIDTGCVFGGKLSAFRYPEQEILSIDAAKVYCEPVKPFIAEEGGDELDLAPQQQHDDLLDIEDVLGKRIIQTKLHSTITIREEHSTPALEVMSRFAVNPKWLIYLPPTMSPCETSQQPDYLEHPDQAFAYYRKNGVEQAICEEKHMGSRCMVIVCRDEKTMTARFGITDEKPGVAYTRTGRSFFKDETFEVALIDRLRSALDQSGFWEKFDTDWVCFDGELMPWSIKAKELLHSQYAAVGAAATVSLSATVNAMRQAIARGDIESSFPTKEGSSSNPMDIEMTLHRFSERLGLIDRYREAFRHYCWQVESIDDLKYAPFHILATQRYVYSDRDHRWHMETLRDICEQDPNLLLATPYRIVELNDDDSCNRAVEWWTDLTEKGGEGMVVKSMDFIVKGKRGLIQPAVKVRGRDYLRIIYGPEYTLPESLDRLRSRGLGKKRSLALREFALGIESLDRFVRGEPLRHIHECVFGVLALESEPVDPRL